VKVVCLCIILEAWSKLLYSYIYIYMCICIFFVYSVYGTYSSISRSPGFLRTSSVQLFALDTPESYGSDTLITAALKESWQAGKEGMSSLDGEK